MYRFYNERSGGARFGAQAAGRGQGQREYDEFTGRIIVVDLAEIDGQSEDFEGRSWLEWHTKERLPVGFDLEWIPDRSKDTNHPISLMQFADKDTCLLLRTHRTQNWLPAAVLQCLQSTVCLKAGLGWDGPDKLKMANTFNLQPLGVLDLCKIAEDKVLPERGLKALAERFNIRIRKDGRVARSNWDAPALSQEQKQYAAEDAYFTFVLLEKLQSLPDVIPQDFNEGYANINQGVLELRPGWDKQGIVRRHDGLYCTMCNKGPMTVPLVVERHMEGAKHRKNFEEAFGEPDVASKHSELPEEFADQGIIAGDGINGLKIGEYKCITCETGPLASLDTVKGHLASKRHIKLTYGGEGGSAEDSTPGAISDSLWNLPDYVEVAGPKLDCTICQTQLALIPMLVHLGGDKHARKCRSMGFAEVLYIKDKQRLEEMLTGRPLVRTGFKKPHRSAGASKSSRSSGGVHNAGASTSAGPSGGVGSDAGAERKPDTGKVSSSASTPHSGFQATPQQLALAHGWTQHLDPASGCSYYHHASTQASQWERPSEPLVDTSATSVPVSPAATEPARTWEEPLWARQEPARAQDEPAWTPEPARAWEEEPARTPEEPSQAWEEPSTYTQDPDLLSGEKRCPQAVLPPGWQAVWCEETRRYYYADVETQISQWDQPETYVHRDWRRQVDPGGRAFWNCSQLQISFYETDGTWQRNVDESQRIYWSNQANGIRFLEPSFDS